mmetsp:Transcript_32744/g.81114  ORF Transcript_32744/g.81114 Transcript_32744/m.81114 type:complete len:118 (+) Transcript_32744:561-914(+)
MALMVLIMAVKVALRVEQTSAQATTTSAAANRSPGADVTLKHKSRSSLPVGMSGEGRNAAACEESGPALWSWLPRHGVWWVAKSSKDNEQGGGKTHQIIENATRLHHTASAPSQNEP